MNFGEFNESFHNNPEAKHPEQDTLYSILDKVTQLTGLNVGHLPWDGPIGRSVQMYEVPATLDEAEQKTKHLSITRFYASQNPNQLASITQTERLGDSADRLLTKYDLETSPDGLQIEKHLKVVNIYANGLIGFAPRYSPAVIRELERRIQAEREIHAEEDASGLSFVSETEARELLRMLHEDFIPINRKPKQ